MGGGDGQRVRSWPSPLVERAPMDQAEATTLVSLLYQTILGREADPAGLQEKVDSLVRRRRSVVELVRVFQSSREFQDRLRLTRPNLTGFPVLSDTTVFVAP